MSQTMYLQSVICLNTSESGHDEVYVKYSIDGGSSTRFPSSSADPDYHSMNTDDNNPWVTNLKLQFNNTVLIELWDSDTGGDDPLGSYTYSAADAPYTESQLVTDTNGARYVLVTGPAVK